MMVRRLIALCGVAFTASCDDGSYTLYRNSALEDGAKFRLHIASFDTAGGEDYNRENCEIARGLFQNQLGAKVRYWCEKGRYRK